LLLRTVLALLVHFCACARALVERVRGVGAVWGVWGAGLGLCSCPCRVCDRAPRFCVGALHTCGRAQCLLSCQFIFQEGYPALVFQCLLSAVGEGRGLGAVWGVWGVWGPDLRVRVCVRVCVCV